MDLLVGVGMIIYILTGVSFGIEFPPASDDTKMVAVMGTGLMIGWTFLLIWGDRKPIERKALLLFTVFPVISLFFIFDYYLFFSNNSRITIEMMVSFTILRSILIALFITGYIFAKQLENN